MPLTQVQGGMILPSTTLTTPIVATTMGVGGATPAASGSGITFPATQSASSDANTLDDYEEGTWTPSLGVNGFNNSATLSSASGRYTKVGRLVTVQCAINMSGFCRPTGYVQIDGLPFTAAAVFVGTFGGSNAGSGIQGGSVVIYGTNNMVWYPTNGSVDSVTWFCTVTYEV
jgi:hypothetical protein